MIDEQFAQESEVRTVISVDYGSIENLIDRHFGKSAGFTECYELPCLEERGSGSGDDWEITVYADADINMLDISPNQHGGYKQFRTRAFLNYLCFTGVIQPGRYLIDISW